MKILLVFIAVILLPLILFASDPWDNTSKVLFTMLCITTVADGVTTHNSIQDGNREINFTMPDRPSGHTITAHMVGQTVVNFGIADILPELWSIGGYIIQPRKIFLSTAITIRIGGTVNNLIITHGI